MRRDLHRRVKALEGDAIPDDAGQVVEVEVTPEMLAMLRDNPSDAAAFKRMGEGDKTAYTDMSTPILRLIADLAREKREDDDAAFMRVVEEAKREGDGAGQGGNL